MRQVRFACGSPGTPSPWPNQKRKKDITSPEDPTHEATTPPGNGEADEEAVEQGEDKLDQAGGGH